jgi:hypothetical protein
VLAAFAGLVAGCGARARLSWRRSCCRAVTPPRCTRCRVAGPATSLPLRPAVIAGGVRGLVSRSSRGQRRPGGATGR